MLKFKKVCIFTAHKKYSQNKFRHIKVFFHLELRYFRLFFSICFHFQLWNQRCVNKLGLRQISKLYFFIGMCLDLMRCCCCCECMAGFCLWWRSSLFPHVKDCLGSVNAIVRYTWSISSMCLCETFTNEDSKSVKSCLSWVSFLCFWDLHA